MVKVEQCRLIIRTGEHGTDNDVVVRINGFRLVARKLAGGTDSGETMLSTLFLGSVIHSLTLSHDGGGQWDIDYVEFFGLQEDGRVCYAKIRPEDPLVDGRELALWSEASPKPAAPIDEGFEV